MFVFCLVFRKLKQHPIYTISGMLSCHVILCSVTAHKKLERFSVCFEKSICTESEIYYYRYLFIYLKVVSICYQDFP